jgi:hypothetical protein
MLHRRRGKETWPRSPSKPPSTQEKETWSHAEPLYRSSTQEKVVKKTKKCWSRRPKKKEALIGAGGGNNPASNAM